MIYVLYVPYWKAAFGRASLEDMYSEYSSGVSKSHLKNRML
jgi:hypothetical protein